MQVLVTSRDPCFGPIDSRQNCPSGEHPFFAAKEDVGWIESCGHEWPILSHAAPPKGMRTVTELNISVSKYNQTDNAIKKVLVSIGKFWDITLK
jgi:hypothetical protein